MVVKKVLSKVGFALKLIKSRIFGYKVTKFISGSKDSPNRILYIANSYVPSLQLSFIKPLDVLVNSGEISFDLITEQQIREVFGKKPKQEKVHRWIHKRISFFNPTSIVFCRYSGPFSEYMISLANEMEVPSIYHIDDDLLNVPKQIGLEKYRYHNESHRLNTVNYLVGNTDLVYYSTRLLENKFKSYGYGNRSFIGSVYCSGEVLVSNINRPVKKIGYMGFDHAHDFEILLPSLIKILRKYKYVEFEIFGSIPKPIELDEFGKRIKMIPPVPNYTDFMKKFATLNWDIGLCPLADTDFNRVKANTKWVEYTSIGAAVIATGGMVYDECCNNESGILVFENEEWFKKIQALILDHEFKNKIISNAQKKLRSQYSIESLRSQVLEVMDLAGKIKKSGKSAI